MKYTEYTVHRDSETGLLEIYDIDGLVGTLKSRMWEALGAPPVAPGTGGVFLMALDIRAPVPGRRGIRSDATATRRGGTPRSRPRSSQSGSRRTPRAPRTPRQSTTSRETS